MQARSALFDLFGDYLRPRGGRAPVAAMVRLLTPLGVAAPAVRTAVSRMVGQGWLAPVRLDDGPGYQLTTRATRRLDDAARRIYRISLEEWNGTFDLILLDQPAQRGERNRLAAQLAYLGYGRLDSLTWLSPHAASEADALLREAGIAYERFQATHAAGSVSAAALVRRAWDLTALDAAYRQFVMDQRAELARITPQSTDEEAYAARFALVHAWRGFLFHDPHLPPDLLPESWSGHDAATFFDQNEAALRPAADRFVDSCLSAQKGTP